MEELITYQHLNTYSGLYKFGTIGKIISKYLMKILKIHTINNIYNLVKEKKDQDFFNALLKEVKIKVSFYNEDMQRIPKTGSFIIISNHPLGALDGIIMIKYLSSIRKDFKIMGNFLLKKITPISDYIFPINPFDIKKNIFNNLNGMRQSFIHLKNGGCLGIFPSGEVSRKNKICGIVEDKNWNITSIKLIQKAKVPVMTMYFHAKNSKIFYYIKEIHPLLQTALLPTEMVKKRVNPIKFRIGKIVTVKEIEKFKNIKDLNEFLRKKVYLYQFYYKKKQSINQYIQFFKKSKNKKIHKIVDETKKENIIEEINILKSKTNTLLFNNHKYEIFFTSSKNISNILREIGRLREITFRLIGEGSSKSIDLDFFDNHYYHLFLWDIQNKNIVGAYRIALGEKIYTKMGIKGFYTSSLFNFKKNIHPVFKNIIEMGRAFIIPEYQQKTLPLFLLWKGILHICIKNPNYKYLIGGVSISNKFSDFSKSLIIQFIRYYYFDTKIAQYVKPKIEYKIKLKNSEKELFFNFLGKDLNKLDKFINEIEPKLKFPILIKKYFKQNAKMISFNVDPLFNNTIDGLMYLKIKNITKKLYN